MEHGFAAVFGVADQLGAGGGDLVQILNAVLLLLRDALVLKTGGARILNIDLETPLAAFARDRSAEGLLEAARRVERAVHEAPYYYHPQARAQFVECLLYEIGLLLRR
jgi:hypothetical protein